MYFAGGLVLPVASGLQRPVEFYGAGARAIVRTAAAIPAFFRMQDDRGLAFNRVRNVNVHLADLDAMVASIAFVRK
jgi:hypothetical protein